ncbi:DUF255 domain-containing protein [Alicyclobacillus contaminans]|uniref:DUF255 domain-containing protein n=1 Tax=Alicyclobacillus contaminans TaxID=392016 RepID=UPI000419901A
MKQESFEDEEVARVLNEHFVAVKVDREERPDIDHIYMTVCQALTGQGGWPLTIVMTPEQRPFFAGTYFPKERRYGRMGLLEILRTIHARWTADPDGITAASLQILAQLKPAMESTMEGDPDDNWLDAAYAGFVEALDETFGGFGDAPKFPTPHNLMFLLRYGHARQEKHALEMVERTVRAMYRGGIYDHVGFGFARYATDREWLVPHFEKMLYDNALMAMVCTELYQITQSRTYRQLAEDIFTYVLREMTDSEGAFYSAQDADSEGEEGKFYLWTPDEIVEVLGEALGQRYCRYYDITEEGNFEGRNIPNRIAISHESFCQAEGIDPSAWADEVRRANEKLYNHRTLRVHPHRDDKVLTGWNGLMIAALAKAGAAFGEPKYVDAAKRAHAFIQSRLRTREGRLLARYRDGDAAHLAYLDDYAFLTWACIELYESTYEPLYLERALELQEDAFQWFWDDENGGFYFYGRDAEALIARPKEIYDGATPSGNSVAAYNLVRLARLTGRTHYEDFASRLFSAFAAQVGHFPMGHTMFLMAYQFATGGAREIVVADAGDGRARQLLTALQRTFLPNAVVIHRPTTGPALKTMVQLAPFLESQRPIADRTATYLCEYFACDRPMVDVTEALTRICTPVDGGQ